MFFNIGSEKLRWLSVFICFVILNFFLIILSMIPGWIIAGKYKSEVINYFTFISNSIEQSSHSIDELKKEIISYNKMKFIENNKAVKFNFVVYLQEKSETKPNGNKIEISFLDNNRMINISKISEIDPSASINILTNPETIINNVIPKYSHSFYLFKLNETFNPLSMVRPKFTLIFLISTLSAILIALYFTIKIVFFYRKTNGVHVKELKLIKHFNAAQINFLSIIIENVYEDLNQLFNYSIVENKDSKITLERKMDEIRQHLGRIIIFRTKRLVCTKLNLFEEINNALDCCLDQITQKNITIVKNNLCKNIYVYQTDLKNLLILFSTIYHFVMNLPPKGQLTIDIKKNDDLIQVKFSDTIPLDWKYYEFSNTNVKGLEYLFLQYDNLILACTDEDIKVERGTDLISNFFILEYKLNRSEQISNVIKGKFG